MKRGTMMSSTKARRGFPCLVCEGRNQRRRAARCTFQSAFDATKATVVENRPCSLDGSVRQLQLAVHDPIDYMSGMRMTPKAVKPRWLDNYQHPGQKLELTSHEGESIPVAICSSPSEARIESGVGNFSVINVLVERDSRNEFLVKSTPDDVFDVSRIHGPGFSNPVNEEINLTSILEDKRPILIFASGAFGIGTARSAICWDALLASATEQPVVVLYIVKSKESAAFVLEWDSWKDMGVTLIPIYIHENQDDGGGSSNGNAIQLLPPQDRILLQVERLFLNGGAVHGIMGKRLEECAALFSGLSHEESKAVLRCLKTCNISRELILQD